MKLSIYSIFDRVVDSYSTPFFAVNDEVAKRTLREVVSDPTTMIHNNPDDFSLHCIGQFDDVDASIQSKPQPIFICRATELKRPSLLPTAPEEVSNG